MATKPLVVIVGETASGKSDLAIELAKKFNGEIICADSRTIYKGKDIGTAKPSKQEQGSVPHHLLDVIEPDQTYNAAQFKTDALQLIDEITARGHLPIVVGGTGLYIDALIFDYKFADLGAERDAINPRHLAKPIKKSETNLQQLRPQTLLIGLRLDKETLKKRIHNRVEKMVDSGFIDEVKAIGEKYGWDEKAMSGIGYKFFAQYICGEINLDEAKAKFVQGDLNLAKRQRTWFKRNENIHWLDDREQAENLVQTFLKSIES